MQIMLLIKKPDPDQISSITNFLIKNLILTKKPHQTSIILKRSGFVYIPIFMLIILFSQIKFPSLK